VTAGELYPPDDVVDAVLDAAARKAAAAGPTAYLSLREFAERIGVKPDTLHRYNLPPADAIIGDRRGWRPETVDAWNVRRPGRGHRSDLTMRAKVKR